MIIKQSIQLNNQLNAVSNKFKTVFGSGSIPGIDQLVNDFNMTESGAKRVLSTIGQFATGLGQSGQFVREFSTDLAKAAADYAAWSGLPDVNEVAKKFGKATLGETGELKDIGIVIDTQAESFKKLTEEIKKATGASEAQAKQMAITKGIIEQVKVASGAAAAESLDPWKQLSKTMELFNEILAKIGKTFGVIFGPIIAGFNSLLKLPFIQWGTAFAAVFGGIAIGYKRLSSRLKETLATSKEIVNTQKQMPNIHEKLIPIQEKWLNLKQKELKYNEKLADLEERIAYLKTKHKDTYFNLDTTQGKEYHSKTSSRLQSHGNLANAQIALNKFENSLAKTIEKMNISIPSVEGLDASFANLIISLGLLKTTTKSSTAAIVAESLAKKASIKIQALARLSEIQTRKILSKSSFGSIATSIGLFFAGLSGGKGILKGLGVLFKSLWSILKGFLVKLAAVAAPIVAVAGALAILGYGIDYLWKTLQGKSFEDTWLGKTGQWLHELIDSEEIEEAKQRAEQLKRQKEILAEAQRNIDNSNKQIATLQKELLDIKFEEVLKGMNLSEASKTLSAKMESAKKEFLKHLDWSKDIKKYEKETGWTPTGQTNAQRVASEKDQQAKLLEKTIELRRQYEQIGSRAQGISNDISNLFKQAKDSISSLESNFKSFSDSLSYGYKDGVFGNWVEEAKLRTSQESIEKITKNLTHLGNLRGSGVGIENESKIINEQLFNNENLMKAQRFVHEARMKQLSEERQRIIDNYKSTADVIKNTLSNAMKFRSDAINAVQADTMESIRLETRTDNSQDVLSKNVQNIAAQQAAVKVIEEQMLKEQSSAKTTIGKIKDEMIKLNRDLFKTKTGLSNSIEINVIQPY